MLLNDPLSPTDRREIKDILTHRMVHFDPVWRRTTKPRDFACRLVHTVGTKPGYRTSTVEFVHRVQRTVYVVEVKETTDDACVVGFRTF